MTSNEVVFLIIDFIADNVVVEGTFEDWLPISVVTKILNDLIS